MAAAIIETGVLRIQPPNGLRPIRRFREGFKDVSDDEFGALILSDLMSDSSRSGHLIHVDPHREISICFADEVSV